MARQVAELRKLQRHQLKQINKDDLIDSILSYNEEEQLHTITGQFASLMQEINELKAMLSSPDSVVNKRLTEMEARIEKQGRIIAAQQQFLEAVDKKERENNIVILGVPEQNESLEGATNDEDKLEVLWNKIGVEDVRGTHRRLGREANNGESRRSRPILLTLTDKDVRSRVLENSNRLKNAGDNVKSIYIKKDVHPSVRREWKRLRDVEREEKEKPENVGCVIRLDPRERKVYKDGEIIDSWNPLFF